MLKKGDFSILSKNSRYWYRGYKYRLIGDISNNRPYIVYTVDYMIYIMSTNRGRGVSPCR